MMDCNRKSLFSLEPGIFGREKFHITSSEKPAKLQKFAEDGARHNYAEPNFRKTYTGMLIISDPQFQSIDFHQFSLQLVD